MATDGSKPATPSTTANTASGARTARIPATSAETRQAFFDFFREKGHLIVPSSPVVPADDPTLLFTNAGMNAFKGVFLGESEGVSESGKLWKRVADTQRCIRVSGKHNDLEEVGHDTYHHTLFEMLGNWSFGDYFKKEAIEWAWELLVERWGLDPQRLYATVFGGDEADGLAADSEAAEIWRTSTGIAADHILPFGRKDNFWEMGDTGPCGPCSEIHVDLRSEQERAAVPGASLVNTGDPRVMEIWNLVFIQFERVKGGALKPLPAKHVDTGMGFERICAVLQGKSSNYDSDVFSGLIAEIAKRSGIPYGKASESDVAMRVIADHIRAVSFAIADGASPSNDGRGYVVRRILRRAIRYGWDRLGFKQPFMHALVPVLAEQFASVFPELEAQKAFVGDILLAEEKAFLKTLGQGIDLFASMSRGKTEISGDDAFMLHDTYGFPIDLTELMAREKGLGVDTKGFEARMQEQRERARAAGKFETGQAAVEWQFVDGGAGDGAKGGARSAGAFANGFEFVGYDHLEADVHILATAKQGDRHLVMLNRSPFYAESGGQTSDTGTLRKGTEEIRVVDVQKGADGFIHSVDRLPGDAGGLWQAQVDIRRRLETQKHHSCAHLLHAALRQVLGTHVVQKGSLVTYNKVRFDFSHYEALTPDQLRAIERLVNERIQQNIPLTEERDVPIAKAKERGAMMLFGEKYGEKVRMITFDQDYSVELCAGTHVKATGEIGYFRIVSESSVAAGIRRVEGVTGYAVDEVLADEHRVLARIQSMLASKQDVAEDVAGVLAAKKELEEQLQRFRHQQNLLDLKKILSESEALEGGIRLFKGTINGADMEGLKQMGYEALRTHAQSAAIVLASHEPDSGKVFLLAALSEDLVAKGFHSGRWVKALAQIVGGGGGGQANLATAGGKNAKALPEALEQAAELLKSAAG